MKYDILLIAGTSQGNENSPLSELMEFGRVLAGTGPLSAALVVPGYPAERDAHDLQKKICIDVIAVEHPGLCDGDPDLLLRCAVEVTKIFDPSYICFLHDVTGSAVAPAAAAETGASCVTAIDSLTAEGETVVFRRTVLGGKITVGLSPLEKRAFLTVMPGAFPQCREWKMSGEAPRFTSLRPDLGTSRHREREIIMKERGSRRLKEAEVVVSAGRGIGTMENIALIERIAALFKKSAVGSSRPLCDLGWLPYSHQIGTTGETVSPRLYLACGISGTPQHVAGMKNSGMIVSVNRDPDAAISAVAHYIIVDDLVPFLTLFEEMCRHSLGNGGA